MSFSRAAKNPDHFHSSPPQFHDIQNSMTVHVSGNPALEMLL